MITTCNGQEIQVALQTNEMLYCSEILAGMWWKKLHHFVMHPISVDRWCALTVQTTEPPWSTSGINPCESVMSASRNSKQVPVHLYNFTKVCLQVRTWSRWHFARSGNSNNLNENCSYILEIKLLCFLQSYYIWKQFMFLASLNLKKYVLLWLPHDLNMIIRYISFSSFGRKRKTSRFGR